MKKISIIAMLISVMMLFTACGTSTSGSEGKKLRVVTDAAYAPFEYMDGDKIVGFDIDVINAVAKEAGLEIEVVHTGWDPLFVELKDKIADIGISSISINDERKETYDFTVPYFLSINKILVPEGSDIKSAADLKGKVVAVQAGTTGMEAVEGLFGKNHKDIKKFDNNNLAIMELINGGADAVVADNGVLEAYAKNNPDQNLVVINDSDSFEAEYYGMMLPKGSKHKADLDKAVKKIVESGKYEEIYKKWFGEQPDIETLKAQQEKE